MPQRLRFRGAVQSEERLSQFRFQVLQGMKRDMVYDKFKDEISFFFLPRGIDWALVTRFRGEAMRGDGVTGFGDETLWNPELIGTD